MKSIFTRHVAIVACNGGYRNINCSFGCIGCGKCVETCPVGAIELNGYGVAQVDESKCISCEACITECPQGIIQLHDIAVRVFVKCSNKNQGRIARSSCNISCVACGLCEKSCPAGAITVNENLSHINERYCLSCGLCVVKCPRHTICDLRGILSD